MTTPTTDQTLTMAAQQADELASRPRYTHAVVLFFGFTDAGKEVSYFTSEAEAVAFGRAQVAARPEIRCWETRDLINWWAR